MSVYIHHATRPRTRAAITSSDDPVEYEEGVGLRIVLDHDGNLSRLATAELLFADYAGLEAEWEAGSATTVLEAAIQTWYTANSFPTDHMSSTQRAKVGDDLQIT